MKVIANINYIHNVKYAPTKDILDDYKKGKISWQTYEVQYKKLISERKVEIYLKDIKDKYSNICFLCSEFDPKHCHRRILAKYLKNILKEIEVIHL